MIKYRAARGIGQQATGRGANGVPIRQRNVARYRNCGGEQAFVKDAFGPQGRIVELPSTGNQRNDEQKSAK